jgi:branched-chain amino acid transport system permease protein
MDAGTAVTLFLNGLALAAILFLLASGLTLIFGLLDFVNFAHGAFFLVGAYVFAAIAADGGSIALAFAVAIAGGAVGGLVLERVLLRRAYGNELHQFLLTLGLGLVITEIVRIIAGPNFQAVRRLEVLDGDVSVLGGRVQEYRLFLIVLGIAVFAAMLYVLRRTRIGLIVRAGVENSDMVEALGTNVRRAFAVMFAVGTALALLAGAAAAPYYGGAGPALGEEQIVLAFVIAVVGGLGSYVGSALAALLVALLSSYAAFYWEPGASMVPVLLMALVLLVRPQGLVGRARGRV